MQLFLPGIKHGTLRAPTLICQEAGLKATNLDGSIWTADQDPKGLVIAKPKIHQELLGEIEKFLK